MHAGPSLTQAELQTSAEWAAAALQSTQCVVGPDASHAASCAALAQVFRELGASSTQEGEAVAEAEKTHPVGASIPRCVLRRSQTGERLGCTITGLEGLQSM